MEETEDPVRKYLNFLGSIGIAEAQLFENHPDKEQLFCEYTKEFVGLMIDAGPQANNDEVFETIRDFVSSHHPEAGTIANNVDQLAKAIDQAGQG